MSKSSILMLPNSQGQANLVGDKVRADGWYGFTDGLHTVAIYLMNFTGRLRFEASIASDPSDDDWFAVEVQGQEYLEYPKNPLFPTGQGGDTQTIGLNIVGSYTWLRVRIDRSYLMPVPTTPMEIQALGYVDRILLNN